MRRQCCIFLPQHVADSLERINETSGNHYMIGVYNWPSGVKWDRVVVVILEVHEGEDTIVAAKRLGVAFAEELEKNTEPYKRGEIVGLKTICRYAYITSSRSI